MPVFSMKLHLSFITVHRHKLAQHKGLCIIVHPVMVEKLSLCSNKQLEDGSFREHIKLNQGYHRSNKILCLRGPIINSDLVP